MSECLSIVSCLVKRGFFSNLDVISNILEKKPKKTNRNVEGYMLRKLSHLTILLAIWESHLHHSRF